MGTLPLSARVAVAARRQHGLVTGAQLADLGVTPKQVRGWAESGRLDRVSPGVLRIAGAPKTHEQALFAAVLWAGSDALVSHRSESALEVMAARLLRASDLPKPQRQVEVIASGMRYRLDFAWPDQLVALECDGRKWHEIERDYERDRERWSAIAAATGYRFVFATWRRVKAQPEAIVAELRDDRP